MSQNTSTAVMQRRVEPNHSLDDYPTPHWGTRALFEHVLRPAGLLPIESACEPACGRRFMADAISEYVKGPVVESDVHDYGQAIVRDYLFPPRHADGVDWVITNPPFRLAEQFAIAAMQDARIGAALLCRLAFAESTGRLLRLFGPTPPAYIAVFSERLVLHKGRLSPNGSTATSYAWFVWLVGRPEITETKFLWIPPCRKQLERPSDYQ